MKIIVVVLIRQKTIRADTEADILRRAKEIGDQGTESF